MQDAEHVTCRSSSNNTKSRDVGQAAKRQGWFNVGLHVYCKGGGGLRAGGMRWQLARQLDVNGAKLTGASSRGQAADS